MNTGPMKFVHDVAKDTCMICLELPRFVSLVMRFQKNQSLMMEMVAKNIVTTN